MGNRKKITLLLVIALCLMFGVLVYQFFSEPFFLLQDKAQIASDSIQSIGLKEKATQRNHLNKRRLLSSADENEEVSEGYIFDCSKAVVEEVGNPKKVHEEFIATLKQSSFPEHQLGAILFDNNINENERFNLLLNYKNKHTETPSLMMDIIGRCSGREISCDDSLIEQAIELDGNNSALWLLLANYYFEKKNIDSALKAMDSAVRASDFNDFYYDDVSLYVRTSKGLLDVPLAHRVISGIGILAAKPLWISEVAHFCLNSENLTAQQNYLCLETGKLMEHNASLSIANMIGVQFQEKAYEREGNDELLASIKLHANKMEAWSTTHNDSFVLSTFDEGLFLYWLDSAMHYGESKAQQMLIEEAITLSKNEYYNPCPQYKD